MENLIINIKIRTLVVFFSFFFYGLSSAQNSYPLLEKMIKKKLYLSAYQQALKLRVKNEGDPRFDYLYGLSALQTAHYNEAVFALDRVTIAKPRVIRPRLELARAYLKLNNKAAALKEFNDVLALSPPPIVRKNVSAFVSSISEEDSSQISQSIIKRLASFSVGYNDNVNFGHDNSAIDLPRFGLVTLNSSLVKQQSGFAEAKFQLMQKKTLNKRNSYFLAGNITHRKYFETSDFDFTDIDLRTGFAINYNDKQLQFVVRDRPVFLGAGLHSNTFGIDATIRKNLGKSKVISTSLSIENYDNKNQPLSDRKRATLGVNLNQVINNNQHQFNLLAGKEFPDKKEGRSMSRDFIGLGYKTSYDWNPKNTSFIHLGYSNYRHQAVYPIYSNKRKDDRFTLKITHERLITDKASLVLSAQHTNNRSNLDLYNAKSNELKVGIRYEWD